MSERYPTSVIVTGILVGGFITVCLIVGLVILAATGHSTEAITSFFGAGNLGALIYLIARLRSIEQNVNGTQNKLIDAAIKSPPVEVTQ
jgi:purine-cytosine permease-like protein